MVNKFFIYVLSFSSISASFAQKEFQIDKYRNAHVETDKSTAQFRVSTIHIKNKTKNNYFWYDNKVVHETRGNYSGYLLDGDYKEFSYPQNDLLISGRFKNGVKTGKWLRWAKDGSIIESATWKNGQLNGAKVYYDAKGGIAKTETYHKNICRSCMAKKKQSFTEHLNSFLSKYNIVKKK